MKKSWICLTLLASLCAGPLAARAAEAAAATNKLADPSIEQRLEDLEAYINNTGRQADTPTNHVSSKLGSVNAKGDTFTANPGPGHNAWQMTSAALVLFMTLPGLALFYGGLVRRKNVLSVMAQCFFITGMVTILWWACGYSLAFAKGGPLSPVLGSFDFAFFNGVDSSAEHRLFLVGVAQRLCHVSTDVRDHHPGLDHRRHRRAHEILRHLPVYDAVDVHRLFPASPHDLGRGWHDERRVQSRRQNPRH